MVTIRLSRGGAKKRPFYHITVTDSRSSRDGRFIERIGFFNPRATGGEERLRLDQERMDYWRSQGAQMSPRVVTLARDAAKAPSTETIPPRFHSCLTVCQHSHSTRGGSSPAQGQAEGPTGQCEAACYPWPRWIL